MRLILSASLMLLLFSCQKENMQPQVIRELGFDVSQVRPGNSIKTSAISFSSMEDAKAYLAAFRGRVVSGNVHVRKTGRYGPLRNLLERNHIDIPEGMSGVPGGDDGKHEPPDDQGGSGSYNTVIKDYTLWVGYMVSFTWEKDLSGMPKNVSNFSSSTLGFTLGTSWEHQNGSAYTTGNTIYYSVNGIQNYNIIVDGIGTLFSQHVKISGSYNTKTGAYTMKQE